MRNSFRLFSSPLFLSWQLFGILVFIRNSPLKKKLKQLLTRPKRSLKKNKKKAPFGASAISNQRALRGPFFCHSKSSACFCWCLVLPCSHALVDCPGLGPLRGSLTMEKDSFIGNSGETRLIICHRQAFHQFSKRYRTILDFSLFPLYPPPYGTNAPGETLALLPCGAPAGKGTMGKARDTCILNKRYLLRNQLTPAKNAIRASEPQASFCQSVFFNLPSLSLLTFLRKSATRISSPQASLHKRSVPNNSL